MFLLSIRNSGGQGWILSSMSECYTSSRSQRSMLQSGSSWQSFTLLATEVSEVLKVINERYRLYVRFWLRMQYEPYRGYRQGIRGQLEKEKAFDLQ